MSARQVHGFFRDEQGDKSLARVLCLGALLFTFAIIVWDTNSPVEVPGAVWALLTSIDLALIGWAAGPRLARYLFPQVGAAAQGVASASKRLAGTDNRYRDDERG